MCWRAVNTNNVEYILLQTNEGLEMEFMEFSVKFKDIWREELQCRGNHGVHILISAVLYVPVNTDMNPRVTVRQEAGGAGGNSQFA
jgi:hypothetical protein